MKTLGIGLLAATLAGGLMLQPAWAESPSATTSGHAAAVQVSTNIIKGRPDINAQRTGSRAYLEKDYAAALHAYKTGAKYGDKLSQLAIGLMYLNGDGITADPATAWAWLDLAASHGEASYVATRDRVWAGLDAQQRSAAQADRDGLARTYADRLTAARLHSVHQAALTATALPNVGSPEFVAGALANSQARN